MADQRPRNLDPGTRLILAELRDLRLEMRADRRRADEERREDRRRADEERRRYGEERRQYDEERRRSDERFERLMQDFEQRSARREATTQRAFKDIRTVGLSIVKTLNHHTRMFERQAQILERIDRKLGARGNGRPGPEDGAPPRR
ncbi:MAG: hypothetical protein ACREKS_13540 [Candidatus Rokuibacteriota bacterium]